ncbi:hypothetical protein PJ985_16295 [Streptomyces sp. ACA25]|uniref:hypothetical protein n=1 Tax=Streptomyces sp. ACA25 TaxID=3022596 RepID=UPI0023077BBF|nr:hypothetical protein [Streptomyces sp. ACA25]MDB1089123.1 hypothetical protein [Streptomyces sp. ACA25]
MPRRVSLPAADELFRTTGGAAVQSSTPHDPGGTASASPGRGEAEDRLSGREEERRSGRKARTGSDGDRSGGGPDKAERAGREEPEVRPARDTPVPAQAMREAARSGSRSGSSAGDSGRSGQPSGTAQRRGRAARRPTGRERHDEKITVYVSAEELMDLEHARLVLRGEHGLAVDRGRIVREAVAVVLADLESRGDASILVRRLRGR